MIFKIFGKSSEIFGNLRKSSEIFISVQKYSESFRNDSKVIFRCFYDFLKFSENLRKCSEIFGDIFTNEDMENILRGTRMYCHMDSVSGLFSSKTLLPIY